MTDPYDVVRRCTEEHLRAVEEAVAEVGLAGGGKVYVETLTPACMRHEDGKVTVTRRLWKVPHDADPPKDLPDPPCYVIHVVPAMGKG